MTVKKPIQLLKEINIIHIVLTLVSVAVVGTLYTVKSRSGSDTDVGNDLIILEYLVPTMAFISIAFAYYFGKKRLKQMDTSDSLISKLGVYRINNIVMWASLEGSIYFAIVSYYISGRNNLLLYSFMLVVLLIYFRPLKSRTIEDLRLEPAEAEQLDETHG